MLNIAICDDDKMICAQIENIILEYQKCFQKNIDIQVYYTGESLLHEIEKNNSNNIDLIFLDIELFKLSGIDIATIIRKQFNNHRIQIVYISGYPQYAMDLFNSHPLNFLVKPINPQNVIENIELCYKLLSKENHYFSYKTKFTTKKIPLHEIIYFESNDRKITIFTKDGTDTFYAKLGNLYEELKENRFLLIHKSYLVNYTHIKFLHYEYVILENNTELPISQKRRKIIREQSRDLIQNK